MTTSTTSGQSCLIFFKGEIDWNDTIRLGRHLGYSWQRIADEIGVSKGKLYKFAHKRFLTRTRKIPEGEPLPALGFRRLMTVDDMTIDDRAGFECKTVDEVVADIMEKVAGVLPYSDKCAVVELGVRADIPARKAIEVFWRTLVALSDAVAGRSEQMTAAFLDCGLDPDLIAMDPRGELQIDFFYQFALSYVWGDVDQRAKALVEIYGSELAASADTMLVIASTSGRGDLSETDIELIDEAFMPIDWDTSKPPVITPRSETITLAAGEVEFGSMRGGEFVGDGKRYGFHDATISIGTLPAGGLTEEPFMKSRGVDGEARADRVLAYDHTDRQWLLRADLRTRAHTANPLCDGSDMTAFFTADLHFGHANILRFCERPFGSIEEHDRALIERWNAVVGPQDVVWHLGDFSYRGGGKLARRAFGELNGSKHLIAGNHDNAAVRDLGWSSVRDYADIVVEGQRVIAFHYGMRVWPAMRHGSVQLYGHSHGKLPGNRQSLDVGVDAWDFRPVTWPEIQARLDTLPELVFASDTDETEPEVTP